MQNLTFRTITGQCNNLEEPYWGAMSTAFLREIEVGEYNPKTEFIVTGGAADGGEYTRQDVHNCEIATKIFENYY